MTDAARSRVLVVDDDASVRNILSRILEGAYEVIAVGSGEEAMSFLNGTERLPDLVLLDVRMPGMDGYEVCARMQKQDELAWIPVVFVTLLETDEDRRRAFAVGAADYIRKPFDRQDLLRTVAQYVGTRETWSSIREEPARQQSWLLPSTFEAFRRYLLEQRGATADQAAAVRDVSPGDAYEIARLLRISEEQFARYLARFLEIPYAERIQSDEIALGKLPLTFCASNNVLVLRNESVVVANPFDWTLMDVLERTLWRDSPPVLAVTAPERIRRLCSEEEEVVESGPVEGAAIPLDAAADDLEEEGARTQALAGEVLRGAVDDGASDVHLEPKEHGTLVRYRIDGDMHDVRILKPPQGARIISRLKALAGMDIAERRKPQDGALAVSIEERRFKLRLATSSTALGETLVVRILEPGKEAIPLEDLGFSSVQARELRDLADRSQGLIVVVGPTGSGKSTTIFSLLSTVDGRARSIMSVEDPVEYRIPYANQQQVNVRAGVSFEALLKSAMRQDPDILFLGEVRDPFSARAVMEFASSGHLTISTLHSSNSTTAVFRLERLGVERGAMADAISGVVAQKLLKRLCQECREVGPLSEEEARMLEPFTDDLPETVARPVGCPACRETGYAGREVVAELLPFDADVARLVRDSHSIAEIRGFCAERGDELIGRHALAKLRALTFSVTDVYEQVLVEDRALGTVAAAGEPRDAGVPRSGAPPAEAQTKRPPAPAAAMATEERTPPGRADGGSSVPPSLRAPATAPLVLVVDDDPDIRVLVELHLTNAGYRVLMAADGIEALLELGSRDVDVVVSDVNMPNLDGVKLMEMIGQKGVDVPAIFLTGTEDEDMEARLLAIGAADYIRKPVRKEVLLMRLRNAVRGRAPSAGERR